jgi:hypothetical protein
MEIIASILRFLDYQATTPKTLGLYHIFFLLLTAAVTVFMCRQARHHNAQQVRKVLRFTALLVIGLEIYKQINYTFSYTDGITASYQWYAFPWQFCSTPMYVGLLAGVTRKGRIHDSLCAYLTTFAVFAGLAVMLYPGDVFTGTVGINLQTMICHGSMVVIGGYLLASGHVKLESKTVLKAVPVFAVTIGIAMILNEVAFRTGLLENHGFNMFYISPHQPGHLPVYSLVQQVVPYPLSLVIYIVGFSAAAWLMLLIPMAGKHLVHTLSSNRRPQMGKMQ